MVKPDWHITGGFERILAPITAGIEAAGHTVTTHRVDVRDVRPNPYWTDISPAVRARLSDFLGYMGLVELCQQVEVGDADVVITTQPPSFAIDHPRRMALFYHHYRPAYDLEDTMIAAGLVDPIVHRLAAERIRRVDAAYLAGVHAFSAPSETVRARLLRFNHRSDNVHPFYAASPAAPETNSDTVRGRHVLCVTRHEFPKRAELVVAAMKYLPEAQAVITGTGGRLAWTRRLDDQLTAEAVDLDQLGDAELWLNPGIVPSNPAAPSPITNKSNVHFAGHVSDFELQRLYAEAVCFVAPALDEDYGLTALEAMGHGVPVVTCFDSGGLTETVQAGVNGLVVDPSPRAIAEAVRTLVDNRDLAAEMGRAARVRAAEFTWERATAQLLETLERAAG